MKRLTPVALALALAPALATGGSGARATDGLVHTAGPRDVVPGVAALPAIVDPADDAQRRINAAVERLDGKVRAAAAACRRDAGRNAHWSRSATVTMHGPRFLSYLITDDAFCGGAHPNTGTTAIVYDLASGQPVDWSKLLPGALTGTLALASGMDGARMVTLSSQPLHALYLAAYRPRSGDAKADADDDPCREAVAAADAGPPPMVAWLDAGEGGLAVQFDLAHIVQACADPVVVPVAKLRTLGAQPALLDAIAAAHAAAAK